jgi:hypothetical protein
LFLRGIDDNDNDAGNKEKVAGVKGLMIMGGGGGGEWFDDGGLLGVGVSIRESER